MAMNGLRSEYGTAAPPYTKGPYTWDQYVTFTAGTSGNIPMKFGTQIWYVDKGITTAGDGTSPEKALATLAGALAKAGDYDIILVAPNTIETVTTMTITQTGLKIIGANTNRADQSSALKCTTGTSAMFIIKADRVEIANLCLSHRVAAPCIQIGDTAGQAYYQIYIHDCNIEGYGTATYGVCPGEASFGVDTPNLVVENNYFNSFATAAIVANGTRDTYRNNTIVVPVDTMGIYHYKGTGDRNYTVITDNYFTGIANSTTKGIYFRATPTAGQLILTRNYLCGTWDVTITDVGGGCNNYVTDASGGALINC